MRGFGWKDMCNWWDWRDLPPPWKSLPVVLTSLKWGFLYADLFGRILPVWWPLWENGDLFGRILPVLVTFLEYFLVWWINTVHRAGVFFKMRSFIQTLVYVENFWDEWLIPMVTSTQQIKDFMSGIYLAGHFSSIFEWVTGWTVCQFVGVNRQTTVVNSGVKNKVRKLKYGSDQWKNSSQNIPIRFVVTAWKFLTKLLKWQ